MTRDDIIKLAREAGLHLPYWDEDQDPKKDPPRWTMVSPLPPLLERFAALVAAAEREACAELVWPTREIKVWSDEELTAMTGAFNRAQEKHGWYETIMAVGAAALKHRAAAIRARGETK